MKSFRGSYAKTISITLAFVILCSALVPSGKFVQAAPNDDPPLIYGEPPKEVVAGQLYYFDAEASDTESTSFYFEVANLPAWASVDSATGVISGTPTIEDVGVYEGVQVSVYDEAEQYASLPPYDLTVVEGEEELDEEPVLENPQPPTQVNVGELFYYNPEVVDPEEEEISYSASNLPEWLHIDPNTGIISGTPSAEDVGVASGIVFTATEAPAVSVSGVDAINAGEPNAVNNVFQVAVNNPNLPYSPSSLLFCTPVGGSFKTQSIVIPGTSLAEDDEIFGSTVQPTQSNVENSYDGKNSSIKVTPLTTGLSQGSNSKSLSFKLRGQTYTVPLTLILGDNCTTGAVVAPPAGSNAPAGALALSSSKLTFAGVVGQSISGQSLTIKSSGAEIKWSGSADRSWVKLSASNGTTPQSITIDIDASTLTAGLNTAKVSFRDPNNAGVDLTIELNLSAAPAQGAPAAGDLDLVGLEVTQGLQNVKNEMPLVENRATFVLAHLKSRGTKNLENVSGKITVKRPNGTLLGEVTPSNPGGVVNLLIPTATAPAADRDGYKNYYLEENFYFQLKPEWLNGEIVVEFAGVSHTIACSEISDATPDCKVQVNFGLQRPKLPVKIFLGTQPGYTTSQNAVNQVVEILEAFLPLAKVEVTIEPWVVNYQVASNDQARKALSELAARWKADGNPKMHYLAIFDNPAGQGGVAYTDGTLAMVVTRANAATLIAHEFIHNYGLGHIYVNPPTDIDPQFPSYVATRLSEAESGPSAYYGFVTSGLANAPKGATTAYSVRILPNKKENNGGDVNSGGGYWISNFTYRRVLDMAPTLYGTSANVASVAAPAVDTPVTFISGRITTTVLSTSGMIDGMQGEILSSAPQADATGLYSVRLEKSNGDVVATLPFTLSKELEFGQAEGDADSASYFSVVAPQMLDATSTVARVVLLMENTPLSTLNAPADGAPQIQSLAAEDGDGAMTVSAKVQDAQSLRYWLEYSHDGGDTWQEVAAGSLSNGDNQFTVNKDNLPGGTTAHLRLFVSDGFYTTVRTQEITDALTLPNHRPEAFITSVENDDITGDQSLILTGGAFDLEDGPLSGESLTWYSDRDGLLGTGGVLIIPASALSEGAHVFTLEAKDSAGLSNIMTRTVGSEVQAAAVMAPFVATLSEFSSIQPLEILRNTPYAQPELSANGPTVVAVQGTSITTTLLIRNSGNSGELLDWSVQASSVPTWMTLSKTSGQTPDSAVATIDTSALAPGVYTGTLTFTWSNGVESKSTSAPYEVTVTNSPTQAQVLTVTKGGSGSGTVTSAPAGINCGSTCSASITGNTPVTLSAQAGEGSVFAGWSGACTNSAGSCQVTMDNAKTVAAIFNVAASTKATIYLPAARK